MGGKAIQISVSDRQRAVLERWVRSRADTPYRLVERARMVLLAAEGMSNAEQGRVLGVDRQRPRRWRQRWLLAQPSLANAEDKGVSDRDLAALVAEVLDDRPRPGGPPTFSAEQIAMFIAIACETPEDSGRPVSRWTPREVAEEAIKRGVVKTISARHVDRLLKGGISDRTRRSTG